MVVHITHIAMEVSITRMRIAPTIADPLPEYHYPNDDAESDRLGRFLIFLPFKLGSCVLNTCILTRIWHTDLQHHVFYITYESKLGLSPPNERDRKVKRVLDVGCGTGIWAMDFGNHLHSDLFLG